MIPPMAAVAAVLAGTLTFKVNGDMPAALAVLLTAFIAVALLAETFTARTPS